MCLQKGRKRNNRDYVYKTELGPKVSATSI